MNRPEIYVSVLMICLFCLPNDALATNVTATHVVTVRAEPFAIISLAGSGRKNQVSLVVDSTGIATESHELKWSTNLEGMRVTVQSNLPADEHDYTLRVRAIILDSKGISEGWVTVRQKPSDLVTSVYREIGSCFLQYQAFPRISKKAGRDEHIITYTITE